MWSAGRFEGSNIKIFHHPRVATVCGVVFATASPGLCAPVRPTPVGRGAGVDRARAAQLGRAHALSIIDGLVTSCKNYTMCRTVHGQTDKPLIKNHNRASDCACSVHIISHIAYGSGAHIQEPCTVWHRESCKSSPRDVRRARQFGVYDSTVVSFSSDAAATCTCFAEGSSTRMGHVMAPIVAPVRGPAHQSQ